MATWQTMMQDDEILRVAKFKLGETAGRLVALAGGASDARVRATLIELAETLLAQQRAIDGGADRAHRRARRPLAANAATEA